MKNNEEMLKLKKSILDMIDNISDKKKLQRLHSLVQVVYIEK